MTEYVEDHFSNMVIHEQISVYDQKISEKMENVVSSKLTDYQGVADQKLSFLHPNVHLHSFSFVLLMIYLQRDSRSLLANIKKFFTGSSNRLSFSSNLARPKNHEAKHHIAVQVGLAYVCKRFS